MKTSSGLLAAMCLALAFAGEARADDCHPLTLITSVDLTMAPDNSAALVPVTIKDKPEMLLVDTGGLLTMIEPRVADELGLVRRKGNVGLVNVSGEMSNDFVHTSLQLGTLKAENLPFIVEAPSQGIVDDPTIAGILGPDVLRNYDVDIDFGARKFNLISQDHCDGKVIYWQADAVAVVPMTVMDTGHIQFEVKVDGHDVTAMLDTGADVSVMTLPTAQSVFGIVPGSADTPKTGTLPGKSNASIYEHTFKSLTFEGIGVTNAKVALIPDLMRGVNLQNATPDISTRIVSPTANKRAQSMLIGMDILRHFHIYIAYKERKLYITPAGTPAH
jgi:hypothetical protein